jgi:uncharacterized protein YndB with AHSA1/START domain
MPATMTETQQTTIKSFRIARDTFIAASAEIVFDTLLNPPGAMGDMNVKIEPTVGGRWFRDLGNNTGHLWGHVQVIKPPKLLELVGPMFMSYAAASHIQYRLTEEAGGTRLSLVHTAIGLISPEHEQGVTKGWTDILEQTRAAAEKRAGKK